MENEALLELAQRKFDPLSYEGKPRFMNRDQANLLGNLFNGLAEHVEGLTSDDLAAFIKACLLVSPINCGWSEYAIAELLCKIAQQQVFERMPPIGGHEHD